MSRMMIRPAVVEAHTINVVRKGALYASVCDGCGKCYVPEPDSGSKNQVGLLFDRTYSITEDGVPRTMGNSATFDACSATCSAAIINGKWREAGTGVNFAAVNAQVIRAGSNVGPVTFADQLVDSWHAEPLLSVPETLDLSMRYSHGNGTRGPIGVTGPSGPEPLV